MDSGNTDSKGFWKPLFNTITGLCDPKKLGDAPSTIKFGLLLCGLVLIGCIVEVIILKDDPGYVFACSFINAIALVAIFVLILNREQSGQKQQSANNPEWSQTIVKRPVNPSQVKDLQAILKDTRAKAHKEIKRVFPKSQIKLNHLRCNIFLPDYRDPFAMGSMSMPDSFMINMNSQDERSLQFAPGEGVVGAAFQKNKIMVASVEKVDQRTKIPKWPKEFVMKQEQSERVSKNLKWIMAFPLPNQLGTVNGVFSIDGLSHSMTENILLRLVSEMMPEVLAIASEIEKLDVSKVEVFIG